MKHNHRCDQCGGTAFTAFNQRDLYGQDPACIGENYVTPSCLRCGGPQFKAAIRDSRVAMFLCSSGVTINLCTNIPRVFEVMAEAIPCNICGTGFYPAFADRRRCSVCAGFTKPRDRTCFYCEASGRPPQIVPSSRCGRAICNQCIVSQPCGCNLCGGRAVGRGQLLLREWDIEARVMELRGREESVPWRGNL